MFRTAFLALAIASVATVATHSQTTRPSPHVFKSGDCKDDACARGKWLGFLKLHGQAELGAGPGVQMRLIILNAEPCRQKSDAVEVRRYQLGASPREEVMVCGQARARSLSSQRADAFAKELARPAVGQLNGEFPVYCSFADEGEPIEIHLLEIMEGGRYRLIEWDCEAPDALRTLAGQFEDERAPLP